MPTWEEVESQREAREHRAAREKQAVVAAEQQRQQQKQQAERLRDRVLTITYDDEAATPEEREWVNAVVKEHTPERFGEVDVHRAKLWLSATRDHAKI
jgi:hypothetical protein